MLLDELAPSADSDRDARAIATWLRIGQTDVVADHALDALGRLRSREARDVLIAFRLHRRPGARIKAYTALTRIGDARDVSVVAEGLRDSSPAVRGEVSRLLLDLPTTPARAAAPDLLLALELGVHEAAAAVGKLGDVASVERFGAQVGRLPIHVLLEGYANYLERADLPDPVKLRIVSTLEEISGGVVKDFLTEALGRPDLRVSAQVRQAMATTAGRVVRQQVKP